MNEYQVGDKVQIGPAEWQRCKLGTVTMPDDKVFITSISGLEAQVKLEVGRCVFIDTRSILGPAFEWGEEIEVRQAVTQEWAKRLFLTYIPTPIWMDINPSEIAGVYVRALSPEISAANVTGVNYRHFRKIRQEEKKTELFNPDELPNVIIQQWPTKYLLNELLRREQECNFRSLLIPQKPS